MVWRSTSVTRTNPEGRLPVDVVILAHHERHLRRKLLHLAHGDMVMLDLKEPVHLEHGDLLELEDGNVVEVIAGEELLYEITGRDRLHLTEIAWHLGNRHLAAQIEEERILILRDHVIRTMLLGLGAGVTEISEPFEPLHGAYHHHAASRQESGQGGAGHDH
jgi:urease accessory protein